MSLRQLAKKHAQESQLFVVPKPPPKGLKQRIEGILAELREGKTLMMFCVHLAGGHTVMGCILHHLIECGGWGTNREGWIWKTEADLNAEIGVSGHMLRKFRASLCWDVTNEGKRGQQVCDVSYHKAYGTPHWHYRVHVARLADALSRYTSQKFEAVYAVLLGEVSSIAEWGLQKSKPVSEKTANPLTETNTGTKSETKPEEETETNTDNGFASLVCLSDSVLKLLESRGVILSSAVKAWQARGINLEAITDDAVNEALVDSRATGKVLIGVIANKATALANQPPAEEAYTEFCLCGTHTGGGQCAECDAEATADNDVYTIETVQNTDASWQWIVKDADGNHIKTGEGCTSRFEAQIRANEFMNEGVAI